MEEEEDRLVGTNISRASCPGESFNGLDSARRGDADLSVFRINEEHYIAEESGQTFLINVVCVISCRGRADRDD